MNNYYTTDFSETILNMRARTVRLDRDGDSWTQNENELLIKKFREGEGITAMAMIFSRSDPAIMKQIEALDLYSRNKKTE